MLLVSFLKIFSLLAFVAAELSLKDLLEVAEESSYPLVHPYSLLYGELFNLTDMVHNLRFCHPKLEKELFF